MRSEDQLLEVLERAVEVEAAVDVPMAVAGSGLGIDLLELEFVDNSAGVGRTVAEIAEDAGSIDEVVHKS